MIQSLLKAKHWQIFLFIVVLPFIAQLVFMGIMFNILGVNSQAPEMIYALFIPFIVIFVILMFLMLFVIFAWLWSLVIGLKDNIPEDLQLNLSRFKLFFFIPIVYFIFLGLGFVLLVTATYIAGFYSDLIGRISYVLVPFHLLSMFGIAHTMIVAAKSLKTAELQRATKFSDFIGEFFLIWLYPIGIWILQPRINQLADRNKDLLTEQMIE